MSWFFFKVLPDVQSHIHLAQRNIASKLCGNFEILRDSLHNRNDSPWSNSKARQFFNFFSLFLVLKCCTNILFSKLLWQISPTFVCFYFVCALLYIFFVLIFCFSFFIACLWLLYLELFLHKFNERHFFYQIAFLDDHIWVNASGHIILLWQNWVI